MKYIRDIFIYGWLFWVAGCLPDTSGIAPPSDRLNYPTGLVLVSSESEGGGRYLGVANSNFNLQYNSGTMNAVNLKVLYETLDALEKNSVDSSYWSDKATWLSPDNKEIHIPIRHVVDHKDTVRVGSFASDLELTPSGKRAVLPVRGEKAIFVFDVNPDSGDGPVFDCGQGSDLRCDRKHKVESNGNAALPLEPYEVATLEYGNYTLGFSTHPYDGDVSLFVIDENDVTRPELLAVSGGVVSGVSGIAVRPNTDNPMLSDIFVMGRHDYVSRILILRVLSDSENGSVANPFFGGVGNIATNRELYDFSDARGLSVSRSGHYAYMVMRSPETLIKLDLRTNSVTNMASLGYGSEPSVVALYEHEGEPDDGTADLTIAFVLCFQRDQLFILETDMMMQPHVFNTGAGPHAIAFDYQARKAFIANFTESTISVFNVEADAGQFSHATVTPLDSEIEAQVKIGTPRLPEGHS